MKKTAEFVSPGHPDKICDFIADSILDAYLEGDKESRVAVEVMGGHKLITINGEVTSRVSGDKIQLEKIVKNIVGAEYKIISTLNVNFRAITAGRLQRKFTKYTIFALLKIPIGFIQSFVYLALERPHIIISFGGYLSLPVVFCSWLLGIKSITHEQSTAPGLANKLNSLFTIGLLSTIKLKLLSIYWKKVPII